MPKLYRLHNTQHTYVMPGGTVVSYTRNMRPAERMEEDITISNYIGIGTLSQFMGKSWERFAVKVLCEPLGGLLAKRAFVWLMGETYAPSGELSLSGCIGITLWHGGEPTRLKGFTNLRTVELYQGLHDARWMATANLRSEQGTFTPEEHTHMTKHFGLYHFQRWWQASIARLENL